MSARIVLSVLVTILLGLGVPVPAAEAVDGSDAHVASNQPPALVTAHDHDIEGSWSWPTAAPHQVHRPFSLTNPYGAGHRGIDITASPGAVIAAPASGVVRFAGTVVDRGVLSIEHGDGTVSSFEPVDPAVATGDRVERGDIVANLSTEITHAPDGGLHLGARIGGEYLNPLLLLGALPPAVLLPLGDADRSAPAAPAVSAASAHSSDSGVTRAPIFCVDITSSTTRAAPRPRRARQGDRHHHHDERPNAMRHRLSQPSRFRIADAPRDPGGAPAARPRRLGVRARPLLWLVGTIAVLAAALALVVVAPAGSAQAATYGPGFDDADNGGNGRVGAYRFEGRNVYCLEPLRDRPLGTTTPSGAVGPADFGVSPADLAAVNWAISTHGQNGDPVMASAVAIFVWSVVANDDLASVGTDADARMVRVPEHHRPAVRAALEQLRAGAEDIAAAQDATLTTTLLLEPDPKDWRRGTVTLRASDPNATGVVTLDGATFVDVDSTPESDAEPGDEPEPGDVPAPSGEPAPSTGIPSEGSSGAGTSLGVTAPEAADDHSITLAPEQTVPYYVVTDASGSQELVVRASATVTAGERTWRPRLESFATPGAQLLGGEGGLSLEQIELETQEVTHTPTFAPDIATQVDSPTVNLGDPFVDVWTPSVAEGQWLHDADGRYLPVTATGTLYGPFDAAPEQSSQVPDDAPVAAIVTAVLGGGETDPTGVAVSVSTADLATPVVAEAAGTYVWVVSIDAFDQPDGHGLPAAYSWQDDFGIPAETTVVEPPVSSTPPEPTPTEPMPTPTESAPVDTEPAQTPEEALPQPPAPTETEPPVDTEADLALTDGDPDLQWLMIGGVVVLSIGCVIAALAIKRADARADRRREAALR